MSGRARLRARPELARQVGRCRTSAAPNLKSCCTRKCFDCFSKVISSEECRSLYSGVTVVDTVRGKFTDIKSGDIKFWSEMLAGGSAGGSQAISAQRPARESSLRSTIWIVRNLGLSGLFIGASACLLRDIPFSAIYFPSYATWRRTSSPITGMPAAYLTTPADVIKTRLTKPQRNVRQYPRLLTENDIVCGKGLNREE